MDIDLIKFFLTFREPKHVSRNVSRHNSECNIEGVLLGKIRIKEKKIITENLKI